MAARRSGFPPLSSAKDPGAYPYFKGSISRWVWRVYVQRLTSAGRWFALIAAGFASYGSASLQIQGYVLAGYAMMFWIVAAAAMLLCRPRVRIQASVPQRCIAGGSVRAQVRITQLSRRRGADLTVVPHNLPRDVQTDPPDGVALKQLAKNETVEIAIALQCEQRGKQVIPGFRVESSFPFGLLRARRTFHQQHAILVHPRFTPLVQLGLPSGRRYQPGGVALASQVGESFEYLGNREYRAGDNIRDIDWRATARLQRPIVREWVEEYMLRVAVVLDTHVPRKATAERRAAFECAVSTSAAVSDYMARQDYLVDLFAAGPNLYHLTAGRSLAYLDQILDILACVDASEQPPFDTIEPELAELLERISTVIVVLLDWDEPRRLFAQRIAAQGSAVKIIIVRDSACTLDPNAEDEFEMVVISSADVSSGVQQL